MKKIYSLLSLFIGGILFFTSCGDDTTFTVKGTLGTQKGEEFLVVYDDPIAKIDTILPREGKFEYSFIPDTITLIRLVSNAGQVIPVFADKGWTVTCKGTFENPVLDGNSYNQDYAEFLHSIKKFGDDQDTIRVTAKQFISSHPNSFASAYLIDKYFIQTPNPDIEKIKGLISPLSGEVKDSRILNVALKSIPLEKNREGKSLGYFSVQDRKKKYLSWNTNKDEFILVNFWASWEPKSKIACDSLRAAIKKLPKKHLKVFNISLDYNREQWLKNCKPDADDWIEICNFEGWEAAIVKQNNVLSLPSNILINHQRDILAKDIFGNALVEKIRRQIE